MALKIPVILFSRFHHSNLAENRSSLLFDSHADREARR